MCKMCRGEHWSPAAISGNVRFHGSIWNAPLRRRGAFYIRPCNLGQRKTARASTARPYNALFRQAETVCQKTSALPYRECRGDHWSPASLAQQRAFRDGFLTRHTGTGEQCSPLQEFFDSLSRFPAPKQLCKTNYIKVYCAPAKRSRALLQKKSIFTRQEGSKRKIQLDKYFYLIILTFETNVL